MNVFALISLTAFMVCFFLGNFIYHKNPKSELNIMIALLCILVGILAFIEYEYRQAETIQMAFFWLKISSLWPLVPSFLLHISLIFTKSKYLKYKFTYVLMYLPAIIIILLALSTNLMIYQVFQEYYGWYFTPPPDATLYNIMAFWSILGGLLSGLICFIYYLNSRDIKRKQSKYVFVGLYLPLLISLCTDWILPSMSIRVPEMTMTMSTVGIGFISYGIWKYRFPALTAAVAADKIVDTMSNFLLLLDKDKNIVNINQATSDLLGYDNIELTGKPVEVIFPEKERESVINYFEKLMEKSPITNTETCFLTKSGEIIPVLLSISLIRTKENEIIGIVCIGSDITDITKAQNEIKASLEEKELLLQEVHHRVKNNLQVISSLLNLQSSYVTDENDLELFKDSQSRVRSMAFIHEQIYQSSNFSSIEFSVYIRNLVTYLSHYYSVDQNNINLNINVEDLSMDLNTSIPVGLIVNEIVTNSLKHAFPNNRDGEIYIDLHSINDHQYKLVIADDGVGLPKDFDFENAQTLGLQLVNGLVSQLDGTLKIDGVNGTKFEIIFNKLEYSDRI
jgi:PAS domain S-box-containing protein